MARADHEQRRAHWREVIGRWRGSDLSGAAFCREEGLREWQFRYWVKRIAELDEPAGAGFARVTAAGSGLCVVLPGGLRLEVEPGFDENTLRRFLRAACAPC